MDTIQIAIKLDENKIKDIKRGVLENIERYINNIQSLYEYRYCDCLEISAAGNIIVKISYPRFFAGINAHLISNSTECMQVQHEFCVAIMAHPLLSDAEIILNRVDIPFTFIMKEGYKFYSYQKVFQIFDYVYRKKNQRVTPKAYTDIKNFRAETLIYADTTNIAGYNSKITIYNQYNNLDSKTRDIVELYKMAEKYSDLEKRMRIEVSKRIKRKGFTVSEFSQFNIFEEYSEKYKKYILDNILDLEEVEKFYEEKSQRLAERSLAYRGEIKNFIYESFIYKEIKNIYDYEIIRRAIGKTIENKSTKKNAITTIKKVLNTFQREENIIVMNTYETIKEIRDVIEQHFIY